MMHGLFFQTLRALIVCIAVFWVPGWMELRADQLELNQRFEANIEPILVEYCFECHDEDGVAFDFSSISTVATILKQGRVWQTGLRYLQNRQMPPADNPAPANEDIERLTGWLAEALACIDCQKPLDPGRPTLRRLSRAEYDYTIRDLLHVDLHVARDTFPGDAGGHGFDNFADALFLTPILMERYLYAADRILDEVLASNDARHALFRVMPTAKRSPEQAARSILKTFLPKAFRRPVTSGEIQERVALFKKAMSKNTSFETAMRPVIKSVLISPHFLYRQEADRPGENVYRISDHELAVRLSYFLWSSMPDRILFELADRNELSKPEVLRRQTQRMLKDPKSIALANHFASQWLAFDKIMFVSRHEFSPIKWADRKSMFDEVASLFDAVVKEDLSVLNIIDADFSFLNRELASRYDLNAIKDRMETWSNPDQPQPLKRFTLPDRTRGGVITSAAVLVSTSDTYRTSPVRRGAWIIQELLGIPPPSPPPDVGEISAENKDKSIRQLLTEHAAKSSCASCHQHIDPIGFPLEQFDLHGKFIADRDVKGTLPDGRELTNVVQLKDYLLSQEDLFLRHLVEKLMIYALGRELEYELDECTIRAGLDALKENDYRFSALAHTLIESRAFQFRRNLKSQD